MRAVAVLCSSPSWTRNRRSRPLRDGGIVAVGVAAGLAALIGAVVVSPRTCPGSGEADKWAPANLSLFVLGGLIGFGTILFALVRYGKNGWPYSDVPTAAVLTLLVVGIFVLVAVGEAPMCD